VSKAKIKGRDHEDVVRRLIAAGWTSPSIALYIRTRFGVEVHDSTVRVYRLAEGKHIADEHPDIAQASAHKTFADRHIRQDDFVDTIGVLQEMIHLQRERIEIDIAHEAQMGKLFSSTKGEIKLYAELVAQYQELLQDWGVVPRAGLDVRVEMEQVYSPAQVMPIIDVMTSNEQDMAIQFSKMVNERSKKELASSRTSGDSAP